MDRKSVLGFVLIFIIILLLPFYYRLISNQPVGSAITYDSTYVGKAVKTPKNHENIASVLPTPTAIEDRGLEQLQNIETDLYKITLSSQGGGTIKRILLKKYRRSTANDTSLVVLQPVTSDKPLLIKFVDLNGDSITLNQNFSLTTSNSSKDSSIYINPQDSLVLTYTLQGTEKSLARRTLTFYGNRYYIKQTVDLSGLQPRMAIDQYDLTWEGGLAYTEHQLKDEALYSKAAAYTGGDIENLDVKAGKTNQTKFIGATNWSAIRTKYFTVAFIPQSPALGFKLTASTTPLQGREHQKIFNMYLSLPASKPVAVSIYFGPLDYSQLKDLRVGLENIMSFGSSIIRPISKFFLWSFIELHRIIPNYGWVLIIFSLLIKIALTPLTNISTRSMKEMQQVQPQIMALREKYSNDPQKLNAETMRIYREHGINPMGGCLPLLLQLPILWALFIVFRTTIELRHAHFIFWIRDLSAPDTIFTLPFSIPIYGSQVNILPIIMVISQIFQQKLSGATANQQQKLSMWIMTIFFFFLFNQFPSGLNLYYTLFNILAIVQQKYFPPKPKPKKPRKTTKEVLRQIQAQSRRRFK